MRRIVIAGVLAGLAMFLWEMVAHMILPLGEMGLSALPDEPGMRAALAGHLGGADGLYFFPDMRVNQNPPAGPWGLLLYHPQLNFSYAVMGWEALTELVQGLALAMVLAMAAAATFARRLGIAALVGVAAAFCTSPSYTIWYGFPEAYTIGQMIVVFGDYLVGGAAAALLLRPRAAVAGA